MSSTLGVTMRATDFTPRTRLIIHAMLVWIGGIVLGGMVLDGGALLRLYCIASICLWPALILFAYRRVQWSATESAVFRACPLLLLIACFVLASVVMIIRGE